EVDRQLLVPGAQPAVLLEHVHAPLDHVPPPVRLPVEPVPPVARVLVLPPRDDRPDPSPPQVLPDPRVAIPLVPGQPLRPPAGPPRTGPRNPDRLQHRLELLRLVGLCGGHRERERQPAAVGDQAQLGPVPAAAPTDGVVRRLAVHLFPPRPRPPTGWPGCWS